MNLRTGTQVQYKPADEEKWYMGTVESDIQGRIFIRDSRENCVTFYPSGNDEIREV